MAFDLSLSDEQLALRQRAKASFQTIRERHKSVRAPERPGTAYDEVWSCLAEVGFLGALVPEEYGGNDRGLLPATIVMEELAGQGLHSFGPILTAMGSASIARFGSEKLKEEILPRIASGKLKLAIASTEAEAGFNVLNIKTFAEQQGDHFLVNGSKIYISGADVANYLMLVVRTITREECDRRGLPKSAGLGLLLVDPKTEGLERSPVPSRGEGVLSQFALELKNVRVPTAQRIGNEEHGAKVMFQMFNPERTLAAAMALGISRYCLDLACEHARTRKVFADIPIGAYQSVQHPLAEVAVRQEAIRLMTYRAAWLFDRRGRAGELAESANSAKYLSAELAMQAVDAALDTFGGKGFDEDHGIVHLWEAARLLKTAPISNALILNQIAEHNLELPRSY